MNPPQEDSRGIDRALELAQQAREKVREAQKSMSAISLIISVTADMVHGGDMPAWCGGMVIKALADHAHALLASTHPVLNILEDMSAGQEDLPY